MASVTFAEPAVETLTEVVAKPVENQAKTQARLAEAKSQGDASSVNQNLLVLVGAEPQDKQTIESRLRELSSRDHEQVITVRQPSQIIEALRDEFRKLQGNNGGFKLEKLGILFLGQTEQLARMFTENLNQILKGPAKLIKNIFIAAKDTIQNPILRAQEIIDLSELKGIIKETDLQQLYNAIAQHIQSPEYGTDHPDNPKLNLKEIRNIIFKPPEIRSVRDFFPFVDKIFNLSLS